ncbi:hypothetical protein BJX65DRAFT_276117 [Aspergillus insuetus]
MDYSLLGLMEPTVLRYIHHFLLGTLRSPAKFLPGPPTMPTRNCSHEVQAPLATTIDLLITLLLAASYIPQLIEITAHGTENISGWYVILLTTSATSHLATRARSVFTCSAYACFRHGELKGFDLLSALVVYIQAIVHWVVASILLAVFVSIRSRNQPPTPGTSTKTPSKNKELSGANQSGTPSATTSPSNATVLAIVLTHAVVILPLAIYFLDLITRTEDDDPTIIFFNCLYGILLRITGILTSLTAEIPQVKLMVNRPRDNGGNFNQGSSLSLFGLGLQVIAFIALSASQGWRARDCPSWYSWRSVWTWDWWMKFLVGGGMAASWMALAICQLVVLCVALGLGVGVGSGEKGRIRL